MSEVRYVLTYDFSLTTVNFEQKDIERKEVYCEKYEDLTKAYRIALEMRDFLGQRACRNIRVYKVRLDTQINLEEFM